MRCQRSLLTPPCSLPAALPCSSFLSRGRRQDDWFSTFAQKVGLSNLAADAAAAMETAVYGTSYSSDDEYAGKKQRCCS